MLGIDLSATAAHGLVQHTGGIAQPIVELLHELPAETWQTWFPVPAADLPGARPGAQRPGGRVPGAGCCRGGRVRARPQRGPG